MVALPQSTEAMAALDRAVEQFPRLVVVDHPTCDGFAWLVDPVDCIVYIRQASPCDWTAALMEALDDLTTRCGAQGPPPPLTLIRGERDDEPHDVTRTGTR